MVSLQTRKGHRKWVILLTVIRCLIRKFTTRYAIAYVLWSLNRFRLWSADYEYYYAAGGVSTMVEQGESAPSGSSGGLFKDT